jgi:hypothetical protein
VGARVYEPGIEYGVVAILGTRMSMDPIWIEIERVLVDEVDAFLEPVSNDAAFQGGRYILREILETLDMERYIRNVILEEDDVYREACLAKDAFDLSLLFRGPGIRCSFRSH